MSLALVAGLLILGLFGFFWGGSLFAQGYFYQNPADRLPLRAAVAALVVGLFVGFWLWLDQKHPGTYDTFFAFSGETTREFSEFEAVRWEFDPTTKGIRKDAQGNPVEVTTKYKKVAGGKAATFVEDGTSKKFVTQSTDSMTAALIVNDESGPIRFKAVLKKDDRTGTLNYISDQNERRFVEENGDRYVKHTQIGVIYAPSGGVVFVSLLLNFLLFAVWFLALWPVLKFTWGHALGFSAVMGIVMMLFILPMLFKPNREANKVANAVTAEPGRFAAASEPPRRFDSPLPLYLQVPTAGRS